MQQNSESVQQNIEILKYLIADNSAFEFLQEFSRNRTKSGFAKLFLGNLNMDRFQDISKPGMCVCV